MEFKLPVGVMRVGRQESHWGMGLLANHGNGFDDLFGDNHWGATFDRIMFATQPLAIAQNHGASRHECAADMCLVSIVW